MRDLIFISLEPWDDIWRRNQFVCAELARRHPARTILFVTPTRDLTNAIRRRDFSKLKPAPAWSPPGLPNVVVFTPTKWLPNSLAVGRWFNERTLRRQVVAEARRRGLDRPILWINDHIAAHLVGQVGEAMTVYDITDDWITSNQPAGLLGRIVTLDGLLCRTADAVIVCSARLRELKEPLTPPGRLHLIPNGVDAAHYAGVLDAGPVPAAAAGWQRPVLGYVGTVHPDRVDVDLMVGVAGRLAGRGSIALVGPNYLSPGDVDRLAATGNVHVVGPVKYADVPGYLRAFDVCIVPHRVTPFTESLNPIKLFEYLAAGKPIVSTPVAGFRDHPQHVALAGDAESFVRAALAAVDEPAVAAQARRAEAAHHSWAARVDAIEAVFDAPLRPAAVARPEPLGAVSLVS
jgi:glycosyltransferase involved in cell wall biosynthesis